MNEKIIKILLDESIITPEQLAQAREEQRKSGDSLEVILAKLGVEEQKLMSFLSEKFRVPLVDWSNVQISPEVLSVIPEEKARRYLVFPLEIERTERRQGKITLAMVDPSDLATINEIAFMTGYRVKPMVASEPSILGAIQQHYKVGEEKLREEISSVKSEEMKLGGQVPPAGKGKADHTPTPIKGIEELHDLAKDLTASVEYLEEKEEIIPVGPETQADRWLTQILAQAVKMGASDIHLDSYEKGLAVHYRIDGILYNFGEPPTGLKKAVISALKQRGQITAPTDRTPYQGELTLRLDSKEKVEFLISIYPAFHGEKITLKFRNKAPYLLDVTRLGFEESTLKMFLRLLDVPDGLVLITSPIGGGKTTTFYAVLQRLNKPHLNILTVENSIECFLTGINQVSLESQEAIREKTLQLMDYHPDVLGIGEILDGEGVRTALELSSETLVLATLTAPDTSNALLHLLSFLETPSHPRSDWERNLLLESINWITSQRLVRQICPICKEELRPSSEDLGLLVQMGLSEKEMNTFSLYKGKGCAECNQTGYKGLTGLFEVMRITREIKDSVLTEPLASNLKKILRDMKMMTLERSGLQKIKNGVTSFEEIKRVLAL